MKKFKRRGTKELMKKRVERERERETDIEINGC